MLFLQRKIARLVPVWASFAGYSLMLEAEPSSVEARAAAMFADCEATRSVHRRITAALSAIGTETLMRELLLALLPAECWHITFADLLNADHVATAPPEARAAIALALADVRNGGLPEPLRSAGLTRGVNRRIRLRLIYEGFSTLSGSVAALTFGPATDADRQAVHELTEWRETILTRLAPATGQAPRLWRPHLTLGYFINRGLAAQQQDSLARLQCELDTALSGAVLDFDVVSLFGFGSMVEFWRIGEG